MKDKNLTNIINELLEETDLYPLDEQVVVFFKDNSPVDYLLLSEFNQKQDTFIDEKREVMNLFEALTTFVKENTSIERTLLACKILVCRNIANLTQEELAQKIGFERKNYSKYETGERTPKLENLKKISSACNIDLKYLIW